MALRLVGDFAGSLDDERTVHERWLLGGVRMNQYKIRYILDYIRKQGDLPVDQWGDVLSVDDTLVWFGLDEELTSLEHMELKGELAQLAEAQEFMDRLGLKRL